MALLIPTGFAQVTVPLNHVLLVREAVVTFGVDSSAAGGDYAGLADGIMGVWDGAVAPVLDADVLAGPVELSVGQDGGENLSAVGTVTSQGDRVISSVAANTAVLVRKRTARGGRRGRGRMYVPWCTSDTNVDEAGRIAPAEVTTLQSAFAGFRTALATASADMVILHNEGSSAPGAPDFVTSVSVDNIVGTQRRRLGR